MYATIERCFDSIAQDRDISVGNLDHESLMDRALALAISVAAKNARGLRVAKQALNGCEPMSLKDGYAYGQTFTVRMAASPEAQRAAQAVLDAPSSLAPRGWNGK